MAKISAAQRLENKKILDDIVLSIFWRDGWEGINYYSVTDEAIRCLGEASPIKRHSSLQNYYHCKADFGLALRGKIFPVVVEQLDFTDESTFSDSWNKALEHEPFLRVISLLIGNANNHDTNAMSIQGTERLINLAQKHLGTDIGLAAVESAFGRSVLHLMRS